MLKPLLLTTAIAAVVAGSALAQDTTTQPQSPAVQPPPAPTQNQAAPQGQSAAPSAQTSAQEKPVTPPPAEAIIPSENATDMRADKLIGASVYNAEGKEVGSVKDIIFDKDGKIVGVVLKVGGLLGIGGKSVGIKWNEVEVQPQDDVLKVNYTEEQLKVVPDFKTQDAIAAEQQQQQQQSMPASPTSTQ